MILYWTDVRDEEHLRVPRQRLADDFVFGPNTNGAAAADNNNRKGFTSSSSSQDRRGVAREAAVSSGLATQLNRGARSYYLRARILLIRPTARRDK